MDKVFWVELKKGKGRRGMLTLSKFSVGSCLESLDLGGSKVAADSEETDSYGLDALQDVHLYLLR